eukprot:5157533-Karenia_brevis.AAC.1
MSEEWASISGDATGFRMWTFNFGVALGQVDSKLSEEVRKLMGREDLSGLPTDWDPSMDGQVDQEIYR